MAPTPLDTDLNLLVRQLYRIARSTPTPKFKDAALEALSTLIPLEAAIWGTIVHKPGGAHIHAGHLYKLPPQMIAEYEAVKQHDILSINANTRPGNTINFSISGTKWKLHPSLLLHIRKWGFHNTLATLWADPVLGVSTAISFYRGATGPTFTQRERRLKQLLMLHLVETWNLNAILYFDRPPNDLNSLHRAHALIDREGIVYNADARFAELLRSEFAGWKGPQIPTPLTKRLLEAEGESYRGAAIVASRKRAVEDGLFLINVRPLSGVDHLSPREFAVARDFADGKTYKEIAQKLGISPATVRNQLQSAYHKLGVRSKIALAHQLAETV
ncbi:MAG: hypothetical protein A3G25_00090 [Betaproteobacteria bacterium RIFCSPLOWO2_12_FULL_63_13]|nr:MAG: hypothetical protein A3H32_21160 [Betaproteobacteria bacterium RIFCSPLOWO2_02_FULL_63_19]OGA43982.1 MAG: hypothetical protein A3G25_00090 [Betaproteobacteria bacterium RIFCSPLOWO2_12_FULL_63_13]